MAVDRKRNESWNVGADRLGLDCINGVLRGELQDVTVKVWTEKRGSSGRTTLMGTAFSASLEGEVRLGLDLAREWFVEKFGKLWRALAHGGGEFVSVELSGQWVLEIHAGPVSRPPRVDESCYGPVR